MMQLTNRNKQMKMNNKFIHNGKTRTNGNSKDWHFSRKLHEHACVNTLYLEPVDKGELVRILKSLKDSARGSDELSPKII